MRVRTELEADVTQQQCAINAEVTQHIRPASNTVIKQSQQNTDILDVKVEVRGGSLAEQCPKLLLVELLVCGCEGRIHPIVRCKQSKGLASFASLFLPLEGAVLSLRHWL